ncbi:gap junction delta-4 protein-like [Chanos chanos]|uniref:Gap junction delta-4 protein-like n=1 Tax=Chanos chanos TaxID=29144 RepID=A0A6J2VBQ4_CHACN|nr:gap junction delta-4 protein-like [Chanos chanos]
MDSGKPHRESEWGHVFGSSALTWSPAQGTAEAGLDAAVIFIMVQMKAVELIFITLNHNITFIGKLWLVLFIFLRVVVLIFAGFPLFHDEEERFVCNTIQPGCVNMCYDLFAPLSLCRFWFLHMVFLCVPPAVYSTYHTHGVLSRLNHHSAYTDTSSGGTNIHSPIGAGGTFTGAYLLHLGLRMFLEVFFGMGQCFLFGLSARQTFTCSQMPCASVECFTSRPTEKSFLQQRMLGNVVLSLLISVADLLCVLRQESGKRRGLREGEERERKMRSATLSFGCFKEEKSIPVRRRTPTDHAHVTSTVASPADATRVNSHPPSHSPEGSSEMGGSQLPGHTPGAQA